MERKTRFRIIVFLGLFALLIGAYAAQLYRLQRPSSGPDAVQTVQSYTYETTVQAARGNILDRNGTVLVTNRASYNIEISNYVLFNSDDPNASLLAVIALCDELGLTYIDHLPLSQEKPYTYTLDEQSETWQGYFRAFLTDRDWDSDMAPQNLMKELRRSFKIPNDCTEEQARALVGLRYELALRSCTNLEQYILMSDVSAETLAALMELSVPGLSVQTTTVREYETEYAAHILGRVSLMNGEEWEYYKDLEYSMNARVGKDGLERAFEEALHGTDGQKIITITRDGQILGERWAKEPVAGNNIITTIDIGLQETAERALAEVILDLRENGVGSKQEGTDAEGGALVALEVKTGEVLASASYPTFDLSRYSEDFEENSQADFAPLYNRAILAAYPPGSTYKMVTSIAAIDSGGIGRYYQIEDKGIYTFYDTYQPKCLIYTNYGTTHGIINMMEALSESCNYYFYEAGRITGIDAIDEAAKNLGLGEATGIELAEELGFRANADTKGKLYANDPDQSGWYGADTIAAAIGQSENRFTPMQLASYTAALANGGARYEATFLKRVVSSDYKVLLEENTPTLANSYSFSEEAMKAIEEGMRMAATVGTAATYLKDYDIAVCAKTGTAQHGSPGSDNGSFVCYAPADDPQIAIAVYVEKGAQGGNLAKAAIAVMDEYFKTAQSDNISGENAVN